jgi:hypothetical protein
MKSRRPCPIHVNGKAAGLFSTPFWYQLSNGCPYTGNIFTFKNRVTEHKIIFTLKSVIISFSYSVSGFFYDTNLHFFFSKIVNLRLPFHSLSICFFFLYCFQDLSPAAPSAALAAPGRPYLATTGAPLAAARVAAHWRSSPLVVVVGMFFPLMASMLSRWFSTPFGINYQDVPYPRGV